LLHWIWKNKIKQTGVLFILYTSLCIYVVFMLNGDSSLDSLIVKHIEHIKHMNVFIHTPTLHSCEKWSRFLCFICQLSFDVIFGKEDRAMWWSAAKLTSELFWLSHKLLIFFFSIFPQEESVFGLWESKRIWMHFLFYITQYSQNWLFV